MLLNIRKTKFCNAMNYVEYMKAVENAPFDRSECGECGGIGLMGDYCCNGHMCGCQGKPTDYIPCNCGLPQPTQKQLSMWYLDSVTKRKSEMNLFDDNDKADFEEIVDDSEELIKNSCRVTVDASYDVDLLVARIVEKTQPEVRTVLRKMLQQEAEDMLSKGLYVGSKEEFTPLMRDLMKEVIEEKFEEKYPDVVENKVNDVAEKIEKMDVFGDRRNLTQLTRRIEMEVEERIDAAIQPIIDAQAAKVENYARQYFANNFFKAMDFLNKDIPELEGGE